jgi:hypothetical protein
MHHQHSLDFWGSRIGLGLLICMLLAVGTMILHRLGDTGQALPVEVRAGFHAGSENAGGDFLDHDQQQPQVLAIEGSDAPAIHTSQRTRPSPERPAQSDLR